MKILEKGSGWNIEERCTGRGNGGGGCNSKLLIEEQDIYVTSSFDMLGDRDFYYTFRCPVCNAETDIEENIIPARIKNEALRLYKSKVNDGRGR